MRISRTRFGAFRIWFVGGLMAMNANAAEGPAETNRVQTSATVVDMSVAAPEPLRKNMLDTVQESTSSRIVSLARWVDSFFDDPEYAEEEAYARASFQQSVTFFQNLDPEYRTRVRATVVLPNLNRRLRLSFEGRDEFDVVDTEENLAESTKGSVDDPSVRLQYLFLHQPDIDFGLSGGVRLGESAFYAGPRFKLRAGIGSGWDAKLTQQIFWYTTNDLKTKTELRFDHLVGKRNLFRQAFRTDWDEEKHSSEGFRHTVTPSITQPLQKSAALRYAWSSVYYTRPDPGWTSSTLSVGYRQGIWRKWIILEVGPFVTWDEQFNWDPKPGIAVSLSTIFE